jgi:hypothetical protein
LKKLALIIIITLLIPPEVFGGKIYGTIKAQGKPVPKGILVTISVDTDSTANTSALICSTRTDIKGAYSLYVKKTGDFLLSVSDSVQYKDIIPPFKIRSYTRGVRYNLIIEKNDKGEYILRRE